MSERPDKVTPEAVKRATDRNWFEVRDRLKAAAKCDKDTEKQQRLALGHCRACYYFRHTIVGHGFTDYNCIHCGLCNVHPNTGVPLLCADCGVADGLCRQCLGRMNEKP